MERAPCLLTEDRDFVDQGFRCLKVKGGREVEADIAHIRRVREAVGPEIELRFDANQGYTFEQSLRFVKGGKVADLERNWD